MYIGLQIVVYGFICFTIDYKLLDNELKDEYVPSFLLFIDNVSLKDLRISSAKKKCMS